VNFGGCELLTDASIVAFAVSCPLLKSVNLAECKLLTDLSIGALAGSCPLLNSVDLDYCELITDASARGHGAQSRASRRLYYFR